MQTGNTDTSARDLAFAQRVAKLHKNNSEFFDHRKLELTNAGYTSSASTWERLQICAMFAWRNAESEARIFLDNLILNFK